MHITPTLGNDWRIGASRFLKWMRERGWRRNWIIRGQRFMCVGVIVGLAVEDNDNKKVSE